MFLRRLALPLGLVSLLALSGPAFAVSITVTADGTEDGGSVNSYDLSNNGQLAADSTEEVPHWEMIDAQGVVSDSNHWGGVRRGVELTGLNTYLKEDPFVTNTVGLINPLGSAQTFTITVTLPITAFPYNATINSSIGVTVTDANGNGTVSAMSVAPAGIYSGQVNGGTILTLMPNVTNVSCATSGCSTTVTDNTGLPLLAATPGVANTIGIQLKFKLSAFDQVAITSRFEIVNVPEPTPLMLLGVGLVGLAIAGRRKRTH